MTATIQARGTGYFTLTLALTGLLLQGCGGEDGLAIDPIQTDEAALTRAQDPPTTFNPLPSGHFEVVSGTLTEADAVELPDTNNYEDGWYFRSSVYNGGVFWGYADHKIEAVYDPNMWSLAPYTYQSTFVPETGEGRDGSYSLKQHVAGIQAGVPYPAYSSAYFPGDTQKIRLAYGSEISFRVSAMVRMHTNAYAWIHVYFYNSTGSYLGSRYSYVPASSLEWRQVVIQGALPVGAYSARIRFSSYASNPTKIGYIHFDNLAVRVSNAAVQDGYAVEAWVIDN